MKKHLALLTILTLIVPAGLHARKDTAKVLYVIDGDTIKVSYNGRKESIRLIGIDAPESKKNSKAFKDSRRKGKDVYAITSQGKAATKFVKTLVRSGDTVTILFDIEKRDKYKRLLGYVYLPNGKMLNDEIIKNGYASPLTIPPNVKYKAKFMKSYRYARSHGLGLFKK
jgi:micrococcal nuclease